MDVKCPECNGSGHIEFEPDVGEEGDPLPKDDPGVECDNCEGAGRLQPPRISMSPDDGPSEADLIRFVQAPHGYCAVGDIMWMADTIRRLRTPTAIPEHPVGPLRHASHMFLQAASQYAAQALIPLRPGDDPEGVFRAYLVDVAGRVEAEHPNIARLLRLHADAPVSWDGRDTLSLGDEWANLVEIPGMGVPADLGRTPYDAVVHDVGGEYEHRYRPVAFVRRGTPALRTSVDTSLVEVWIPRGVTP